MTEQQHPTDLVDAIVAAAEAAIRDEAADLRRDPVRIRSVVLELYLDARGRVDEGRCFVERRVKAGRR